MEAVLNPSSIAHYKKGYQCYCEGQLNQALDELRQAIKLDGSVSQYWNLFCEALALVREYPNPTQLKQDLIACLEYTFSYHQKIADTAILQLKAEPEIAELLSISIDWSNLDQWYEQFIVAPILNNQLLQLLMNQVIINDLQFEHSFTDIRKALLQILTKTPPLTVNESLCHFAIAIANQCFITEYIYQETIEEQQLLLELEQQTSQLTNCKNLETIIIFAIIASYKPLYLSKLPSNLLEQFSLYRLRTIDIIYKRQYQEPKQEQELLETIPKLTKITDYTSKTVKAQYETNPYPRWANYSKISPVTVLNYIHEQFPHSAKLDIQIPDNPQLLIAGCGTGKSSVMLAQLFENVSITSVDISLASLAFAKRITAEFDLTNITYALADIMEIDQLQQQFDLIECGGVLHHLQDPNKGLENLKKLLKPKGLMFISLYSRYARKYIIKARQLIQQQGIHSDLEGMRSFRKMIAQHNETQFRERIIHNRDFFTASACRDLLFHEQETQFTLLEIEKMLTHHQLEFLGFQLSIRHKRAYQKACTHDPCANQLKSWHAFELEHPELFSGMYQFWVRNIE